MAADVAVGVDSHVCASAGVAAYAVDTKSFGACARSSWGWESSSLLKSLYRTTIKDHRKPLCELSTVRCIVGVLFTVHGNGAKKMHSSKNNANLRTEQRTL